MLVPGAFNRTKKIRKAGADIFANVGLEKHLKLFKKIKEYNRFFVDFPVNPRLWPGLGGARVA